MKAITDIQPHEDGVHCGECEGPWLVGRVCECAQRRIDFDSECLEYYRSPICLAATKEYDMLSVDAEAADLYCAMYEKESAKLEKAEQQRDAALELLREVWNSCRGCRHHELKASCAGCGAKDRVDALLKEGEK